MKHVVPFRATALHSIAPLACALVLAACPLVRDPAELIDGLNTEVIVTGARVDDRVSFEVDGEVDEVTASEAGVPIVFRRALAAGEHAASLVVARDGLAIGCVQFAVAIDGAAGRAAASFDVATMAGCGGEGEGEEGEGDGEGEDEGDGEGEEGEGDGEGEGEGGGCVIGDPCDDGVACTDDDRCLAPGVCVGQVGDIAECSTCAASCDTSDACCIASDTCDAGSDGNSDALCINRCAMGPCDCAGGACTAHLDGGDATCTAATCRMRMAGTAAAALHCESGATCDARLEDLGLGQVSCVDSRCTIDVRDGQFSTTECTDTDACFVSSDGTNEASLACTDASCALDCGSASCEVVCGNGADCLLTCAEESACEMQCEDGSQRCALACPDDVVTCAPGETCDCQPQ